MGKSLNALNIDRQGVFVGKNSVVLAVEINVNGYDLKTVVRYLKLIGNVDFWHEICGKC
jgi:hypothetical protein